jgi:hypothetical protein
VIFGKIGVLTVEVYFGLGDFDASRQCYILSSGGKVGWKILDL